MFFVVLKLFSSIYFDHLVSVALCAELSCKDRTGHQALLLVVRI